MAIDPDRLLQSPRLDRVKTHASVLVIGPGAEGRGGITSVIRLHSLTAAWRRWRVVHLSTYNDRSATLKLRAALRAYLLAPWLMLRAEIVHVHLAAQISMARKMPFVAMARLLRRPVVVHVHAGSERSLFEQTPRWMVAFVFGSASRVIALSESWAAQIVAHHPGTRVIVIPNPVDDLEPQKRAAREAPVVLFVGKLDARKGYADLLRAAVIVLRTLPRVQFWFAGQGDLVQAEDQAQGLGIASSVRLLGWVDPVELETVYEQAFVLALPSYGEGVPMSVIEAMNRALPVVCTPVGGVPEWVEDRRNGLLVNPGDVPALASALLELLQDPALAAALATAGQATVRSRCTLEATSNRLDTLYTELLADKR